MSKIAFTAEEKTYRTKMLAQNRAILKKAYQFGDRWALVGLDELGHDLLGNVEIFGTESDWASAVQRLKGYWRVSQLLATVPFDQNGTLLMDHRIVPFDNPTTVQAINDVARIVPLQAINDLAVAEEDREDQSAQAQKKRDEQSQARICNLFGIDS